MTDADARRPRRSLVPAVIAAVGVAAVLGVPSVIGALGIGGGAGVVFPREVASYSWWTSPLGPSTIDAATMTYQNGVGVEFGDTPQQVVLGDDGRTYRRLSASEELTIPEDQGDPAQTLLSADGTFVVVGHGDGGGTVEVVRLSDLDRRSLPIGEGRSSIAVSIDAPGESVLLLTSADAMSPYTDGEFRLHGTLARLDLRTGDLQEYDVDDVQAAAITPDGARILAARGGTLLVIDASSGEVEQTVRDVPAAGLDGDAWSPDGTRAALFGGGEVILLDLSGPTADVRTIALPALEYGAVLGWRDAETVLVHAPLPSADNASQFAWIDVSAGKAEPFSTYTPDFTGASLVAPDAARDLVATWQVADRSPDRGPVALAITVGGAVLGGALVGLVVWFLTPRRVPKDVAPAKR